MRGFWQKRSRIVVSECGCVLQKSDRIPMPMLAQRYSTGKNHA
jgi:hypothetical protein